MDDKGQIMIIEAIIFAIFMILSLIFLYTIAPTGTVSNVYTDSQKVQADDAVQTMLENYSINTEYDNYPLNELTHYIVKNDYSNLTSRLNDLLSSNAHFNIYIANSSKSMFWCNSSANNYETISKNAKPLQTTKSIVISSHIVAIPHIFRDNMNSLFSNDYYHNGKYYNDKCDLSNKFDNYNSSVYTFILELWEV